MVNLRKTTPGIKLKPCQKFKPVTGDGKSIKGRKLIESHPIAIGVEAGAEAYGKNPTKKEVVRTEKKFYRPPLPSTYKGTKLLEDLNVGVEWVLRD